MGRPWIGNTLHGGRGSMSSRTDRWRPPGLSPASTGAAARRTRPCMTRMSVDSADVFHSATGGRDDALSGRSATAFPRRPVQVAGDRRVSIAEEETVTRQANRSDPRPRRQAGEPGAEHERHDDDAGDGAAQDDRDKDGGDEDNDRDEDKAKDNNGGKKRRWPIVVLAIVAVLVVAGAIAWWFLTRNEQSTDDAYTDGNAISDRAEDLGLCRRAARRRQQRTCKAGDLMLRIDPRDYVVARDQARANLNLAQGAARQFHRTTWLIERVRAIPRTSSRRRHSSRSPAPARLNAQARISAASTRVDPRATTQTTHRPGQHATAVRTRPRVNSKQIEAQVQISLAGAARTSQSSAKTRSSSGEAQVEQAEANVAQARAEPVVHRDPCAAGRLRSRGATSMSEPIAQAGQQVFYLVAPLRSGSPPTSRRPSSTGCGSGQAGGRSHVDAYPEPEAAWTHPEHPGGQPAPASATFPAENATGNFVKIVRRVPVKMVIDQRARPDGHDACRSGFRWTPPSILK